MKKFLLTASCICLALGAFSTGYIPNSAVTLSQPAMATEAKPAIMGELQKKIDVIEDATVKKRANDIMGVIEKDYMTDPAKKDAFEQLTYKLMGILVEYKDNAEALKAYLGSFPNKPGPSEEDLEKEKEAYFEKLKKDNFNTTTCKEPKTNETWKKAVEKLNKGLKDKDVSVDEYKEDADKLFAAYVDQKCTGEEELTAKEKCEVDKQMEYIDNQCQPKAKRICEADHRYKYENNQCVLRTPDCQSGGQVDANGQPCNGQQQQQQGQGSGGQGKGADALKDAMKNAGQQGGNQGGNQSGQQTPPGNQSQQPAATDSKADNKTTGSTEKKPLGECGKENPIDSGMSDAEIIKACIETGYNNYKKTIEDSCVSQKDAKAEARKNTDVDEECKSATDLGADILKNCAKSGKPGAMKRCCEEAKKAPLNADSDKWPECKESKKCQLQVKNDAVGADGKTPQGGIKTVDGEYDEAGNCKEKK